MADGFAIIETNEQGEGRLKELKWFDFRLEDVLFDDAEGVDQLVSQLPEGIKDVLVLAVFSYVCHCSRSWDGEYDCEEHFDIVSHQILKSNYKEFYRQMVTEQVNIGGKNGLESTNFALEDTTIIQCEKYCEELISEWEEFYDEDFKAYITEPKCNLFDAFNM